MLKKPVEIDIYLSWITLRDDEHIEGHKRVLGLSFLAAAVSGLLITALISAGLLPF